MHRTRLEPTNLDVTILVPCFNAGARLDRCLSGLRDWCATHPVVRVEVIVIDDGSTDDTAARLARFGEEWTALRSLRMGSTRGRGAALRAGVAEARGARVLSLDVDLSVLPAAIGHALARLDAGADIAVGARTLEGSRAVDVGRRGRLPTGRVYTRTARFILGLRVPDVACRCKAFHLDVAQSLFARSRCRGAGIEAEVLKIAQLDGMAIEPIPVMWRVVSPGARGRVWSGLRSLAELVGTRRRAWTGGYRARTEAERAPIPRRQRGSGTPSSRGPGA